MSAFSKETVLSDLKNSKLIQKNVNMSAESDKKDVIIEKLEVFNF